MNVMVCIKQVPDTETKMKVSAGQIDSVGTKWVLNPYDEFAIEEALLFKQSNPSAIVTVFSVGPKTRVPESLRTALAMGADEAVLVDAPENLDSFSTARALAGAIKKTGEPKLVLTGKVAIDDNQSCVSQQLAELLGLPHATVVSKTEYKGDSVRIEREAEGGTKEVISLQMPAVIGANKGLNNPRYASLPGIMKAKKKVIKEMTLADVDVNPSDLYVEYSDFTLPPDRAAIKMLSGDVGAQVQELVRLLKDEAKVL
jgi:electron transfer flavoprotein beta subunit